MAKAKVRAQALMRDKKLSIRERLRASDKYKELQDKALDLMANSLDDAPAPSTSSLNVQRQRPLKRNPEPRTHTPPQPPVVKKRRVHSSNTPLTNAFVRLQVNGFFSTYVPASDQEDFVVFQSFDINKEKDLFEEQQHLIEQCAETIARHTLLFQVEHIPQKHSDATKYPFNVSVHLKAKPIFPNGTQGNWITQPRAINITSKVTLHTVGSEQAAFYATCKNRVVDAIEMLISRMREYQGLALHNAQVIVRPVGQSQPVGCSSKKSKCEVVTHPNLPDLVFEQVLNKVSGNNCLLQAFCTAFGYNGIALTNNFVRHKLFPESLGPIDPKTAKPNHDENKPLPYDKVTMDKIFDFMNDDKLRQRLARKYEGLNPRTMQGYVAYGMDWQILATNIEPETVSNETAESLCMIKLTEPDHCVQIRIREKKVAGDKVTKSTTKAREVHTTPSTFWESCPTCQGKYEDMKQHRDAGCDLNQLNFKARAQGQHILPLMKQSINHSEPCFDKVMSLVMNDDRFLLAAQQESNEFASLDHLARDLLRRKDAFILIWDDDGWLLRLFDHVRKTPDDKLFGHYGMVFGSAGCQNRIYVLRPWIDNSFSLDQIAESFHLTPGVSLNRSMEELWESICKSVYAYSGFNLMGPSADKIKNKYPYLTPADCAWDIWKESLASIRMTGDPWHIHLLKKDRYDFLKRTVVSGRAQSFRSDPWYSDYASQLDAATTSEERAHIAEQIRNANNFMRAFDKNSHYLEAMLNEFPIGEEEWSTKPEEDLKTLTCGFYDVDIEAPDGLKVAAVQTCINGKKYRTWEVVKHGSGVYSHISIKRMQTWGYKVNMTKDGKALVWRNTAKLFAPFVEKGYPLKVNAKKEKQVVWCETIKKMLLSVYGKCLQKENNYQYLTSTNPLEYDQWIENKTLVSMTLGDKVFTACAEVPMTEEEEQRHFYKSPIHLGLLILEYSVDSNAEVLLAAHDAHSGDQLKRGCTDVVHTNIDSFWVTAQAAETLINEGLTHETELGKLKSELHPDAMIYAMFAIGANRHGCKWVMPDGTLDQRVKYSGIGGKNMTFEDLVERGGYSTCPN